MDLVSKYDMVLLDNFLCDIKYATLENFMGKILYYNVPCVIRKGTYNKLCFVQNDLKEMGLQLKIWDAYRPYKVQEEMWEVIQNEKYVSNPSKNTYHPRGNAVDVTLCDLEGNELEMPTDFDSFSLKAAWSSKDDWNDSARRNAILLKMVMERYGFVTIDSEWWHYNDSEEYDVIFD